MDKLTTASQHTFIAPIRTVFVPITQPAAGDALIGARALEGLWATRGVLCGKDKDVGEVKPRSKVNSHSPQKTFTEVLCVLIS